MSMEKKLTQIEQTIRELWAREQEFENATLALPVAEHKYKVAEKVEYLKAEGSIPQREAVAKEKVSELYLEYLQADARATIAKAKLEDARAVLSARQSLERNQFQNNQAFSRNQT